MTTSLHPCPECARHILSSEVSCPFCAAPVVDAMAAMAIAPKRAVVGRMSRAALVALGTLAASPAVAACGGKADDSEDEGDSGDGDSGDGDSGDGDSGDGDSGDGDSGSGGYNGDGDGDSGSGGTNDGGPPSGGALNQGSGGDTNLGTGGDQVGPVYGLPPEFPEN